MPGGRLLTAAGDPAEEGEGGVRLAGEGVGLVEGDVVGAEVLVVDDDAGETAAGREGPSRGGSSAFSVADVASGTAFSEVSSVTRAPAVDVVTLSVVDNATL